MSRKRPTADQMGELMSQPHFRRDGEASESPPSTAPVTRTPMLVEVDNLTTYDRNPRRSPNDKRDELKEYIRQNGFNQVLAITQRPDPEDPDVYMIGVGGNTRLSIMQELWHETGDERFKQMRCEYQPWQGETHTLIAHIQDNDLRGDLTFIDRAIAVQELSAILEEDAGESLSQRALCRGLAEQGYQISRTLLIWYQYTVDTLYPSIPHVLQSGIGRPTIAKIHEMQRAFARTWSVMGIGESEEADSLFEQTLSRHDGDFLDIKALRLDLEEELTISADCDMQRASMELGAALYGRSDSEANAPRSTGQPDAQTGTPTATGDASGQAAAPLIETPSQRSSADAETQSPASETSKPDTKLPTETRSRPAPPTHSGASETQGGSSESPAESPHAQNQPTRTEALPHDLKSLRGRAWTLSSRIAQGSRLGDIVLPISTGLGFLIRPIPLEVQQSWHPEIGRSAMCVWWHLATLAEQFARHGQACVVMPDTWSERPIGQAMRQARDGQEAFSRWQWQTADRELFADVPPLEPNDIGPMLYQSWPEQRWNDWIQLVETYREIYRKADNAPWGKQ